MCVGGGVAVDVSKAVPSNETSRHTNRMRKETVNAESVVGCIRSIEDLGTFHGVIGACLAISITSMCGGIAGALSISV